MEIGTPGVEEDNMNRTGFGGRFIEAASALQTAIENQCRIFFKIL